MSENQPILLSPAFKFPSIKRLDRHGSSPETNISIEPTIVKIRCVGNYDIGKTIGKGQFGKVKQATHVLTGEKVAVKIISKKKLNDKALKMVKREIEILKKLSHPNIIQLYEVLETKRVLFLIMEEASGGEALDFVITHGKMLEERAIVLFRQLVIAINYCHKNGVVHRDLKAENLLLDSDLNIKVIDFGLSNFISENKFNTPCGSPSYVAPEIIRKEEYDGRCVDVWSMGVVLYVFLCGKLPFKDSNMKQLFNTILQGKYDLPLYLSEDCRNLIKSMLTGDPKKRITVTDILNHKWLQTNGWKYNENEHTPISQKLENIDPYISSRLLFLGFNTNDVVSSLQSNAFNQATATYNLLTKQKNQQTTVSVPAIRTKSEKFGKFVDGNVSMPNSAANTPTSSVQTSPRSTGTSPNSQAPIHTFSTIRKKRIEQAIRTRGHKRTNSDMPTAQDMKPKIELNNSKSTLRRRSSSVKSADVPENTTILNSVKEEETKKEKPEILINDKQENIFANSLSVSTDNPKVINKFKGHKRHNSEEVKARNKVFKVRKPVTKPLWVSPSKPIKHHHTSKLEDIPLMLTEQDVKRHKDIEETERNEIIQVANSQTKRTSFSSILSWTKQMLNRKSNEEDVKPREIRTAFSNTTTSRKLPGEIMVEIRRVLEFNDIQYSSNSLFCLKAILPNKDLEFDIEVCRPPNLTDIYVIRLQRISGDWLLYKEQCNIVLNQLNL